MVDPSHVVQIPEDRGWDNRDYSNSDGASPIGEDRHYRKRRWFDPTQHNVNPKTRIVGEGEGHMWEETAHTIDVRVPLKGEYATSVGKRELVVQIEYNRICVALTSGETLFEGNLRGRINTAESMWALCPAGLDRDCKEAHVQLSLEKALGYREVWASVLDNGPAGQEERG